MCVMRAGWGEDYKGRNGQKGHGVHEWTCVSAEPEASSSSACEATSVSPALLKKVQVNLTGIMESVSHTFPSPRWIHTTESPEGPGSWGLLTFCGIHHRHPLLLCCSDAGYELWEKNPGSANGHFKKLKQEQLFRSTLALMAHNGIAL